MQEQALLSPPRPFGQSGPEAGARGLLIAVPLYKGPELLVQLSESLLAMADEISRLDATVLLLNDSPDHDGLARALARVTPRLADALPIEVVTNPANLGFVRTANRGMAMARDSRRDVLLLNSDTLPRPGAFEEMLSVAALDPLIGAVSPRSDNATICDSPYLQDLRRSGRERAYAAHRQVARHLPRCTYVPTTVGFCMLIRWLVIAEFGLFDEVYGIGYNEENDFVRRMNQCGYRAALANHAYVHHVGEASFSRSDRSRADLDETNRQILLERYPETPKLIQNYFEGSEYQTQRLIGGLVPDEQGRLRLLFDCRKLDSYYSGTHEHMVALLRAFVAAHGDEYQTFVTCGEEAFRFHRLDAVPGLRHLPEHEAADRPFAAVFRIAQPFKVDDLTLLESVAPIAGVLMLDTIALDCQQLDDSRLATLWDRMCLSVDLIGFNSRFSADQFNRRFAVPDRIGQFVSLCSTDPRDFARETATLSGRDAILVVGNHFPHKHVEATVAALRRADPTCRIIVLGVQVEAEDVECHVSGMLPNGLVDALYDRARVVLLPSHYEGFGLPILHGLARGRPVVARDLPSAREIRSSCPAGANLHLAATTEELVRLALDMPNWEPAPADAPPGQSWPDAADAIADAIRCEIDRFSYTTLKARRTVANTAKLRLELAASESREPLDLPPLGQGFMLGRALEMQSPVPAMDWRGRVPIALVRGLTPERALTSDRPAPRGAVTFLKLKDDDPGLDPGDAQRHLLRWLTRVAVGGRVRLRFAAAVAARSGEHDVVIATRALLAACGMRVDTVVHERETITAEGVRQGDWQSLMPGPTDDTHFVHYLYRTMLGRHPDDGGAMNYLAELGKGTSRAKLLEIFLCSSERRDLIGHQIARALGG